MTNQFRNNHNPLITPKSKAEPIAAVASGGAPAPTAAPAATTSTAGADTPETAPIFQLIRRVRQLLRGSWVATGLGLTVALYLGVLLTLALLDLLTPLWPALRWVALALVVAPAGWAFITGVARPLLRRLGNRYVARRIESQIPGIHNRLVSCVDLSNEGKRSTFSSEFYRRLVTEALHRITAFRPWSVVDMRNLRRAGTAAGLTTLLFVIAWALLSDRLPTAMARIFAPWADIPPASGVEFTIEINNQPVDPAVVTKVLRGDDIDFKVHVTKGEPRDLRLELMPADGGETIWHELQVRAQNDWTRTLRGFEHSFAYRVHGGGTWSRRHQVQMVDRPRILDLKTVLHYPEYLGMSEGSASPQPTPDVTGPEDSQIEVNVTVEGDVAVGEIQLLNATQRKVEVADRAERIWFEGKLPEGVVQEDIWQWDVTSFPWPVHMQPAAEGARGHLFHTAPTPFHVDPGEYLFADVYLTPDQRPETIMLQWHDGQGWEHRAYWGEDKIGVGQPNTASRYHAGEIPTPDEAAGGWVRLEVPAQVVDLEGKGLKGMAFTLSGGAAAWRASGALPPKFRDELQLVVAKTFPLAPEASEASGKLAASPEADSAPVTESAPVTGSKTGRWTGRFPLRGEGLYRVELRNELGHPNQTMKEAKYVAIKDNPPQVTLERPGSDIVLSQPGKVPLVIAAYDDFALRDLKLLVQRGDTGGFRETATKKYDKPLRGDTANMTLDLSGYDLKPGDLVRYRAQVRDRKDQVAETQDYVVRIQADENAADKQLARFEQAQDTFQEKLVQLIAEQAKVQENIEKMEAKYEPLDEAVRAAEEQAREEARKAAEANPQAPAPAMPPLKLDPELAQKLAELKQELNQAAAQEEQNANVGKQLAAELAHAVEQAAQLQLLPPELMEEMRAAQEAFDKMAVQPMQELTADMRENAAAQGDPQLEELGEFSDRLQEELEAVADRLAALEKARDKMDEGVEEALAELRQELLRQQAGDTARGIEDLKDMIAAIREKLQDLEDKQAELLDGTNVVPDAFLPEAEKQQAKLDQEAAPPLAQAEELLKGDRPERMDREPLFPEAPFAGEEEEILVPQEEEDSPAEPEENADAAAEDAAADDAAQDDAAMEEEAEEEEPLFEPALGGPKPKLDPRFADKRPSPKKDQPAEGQEEPNPQQQQRQELAERQFERLKELNLGQQSLGADEQALEALLAQLEQALQQQGEMPDGDMPEGQMPEGQQPPGQQPPGQQPPGQQPPGQQPGQAPPGQAPDGDMPEGDQPEPAPLDPALAEQLAALLNSPEMQEALAMLQRMEQAQQALAQAQQAPPQPGQPQPSQPPMQPPKGRSFGNLKATVSRGTIMDAELARLDPTTRTVILKMQPKLREELLQGMREQGPEGYRKFIQDYFKRLTTVKGTN